MEERYEPMKELGSGNFGVARLVRDKKTRELVAVKYIERGKKVILSTLIYRIMHEILQMLVLFVRFTSLMNLTCSSAGK